jgi:hypothetical protein
MQGPILVGQQREVELLGKTVVVRRLSRRAYRLYIKGEEQYRNRWASYRHEVEEDLAHVAETGAFPPPGKSWA